MFYQKLKQHGWAFSSHLITFIYTARVASFHFSEWKTKNKTYSFQFSKKSNSGIVIFTVSWDFKQIFLRNTMSESAEIVYTYLYHINK